MCHYIAALGILNAKLIIKPTQKRLLIFVNLCKNQRFKINGSNLHVNTAISTKQGFVLVFHSLHFVLLLNVAEKYLNVAWYLLEILICTDVLYFLMLVVYKIWFLQYFLGWIFNVLNYRLRLQVFCSICIIDLHVDCKLIHGFIILYLVPRKVLLKAKSPFFFSIMTLIIFKKSMIKNNNYKKCYFCNELDSYSDIQPSFRALLGTKEALLFGMITY